MQRCEALKRLEEMAGPDPDPEMKAMLEDARAHMAQMMAHAQTMVDSGIEMMRKETEL
jgi:hypothetical protein